MIKKSKIAVVAAVMVLGMAPTAFAQGPSGLQTVKYQSHSWAPQRGGSNSAGTVTCGSEMGCGYSGSGYDPSIDTQR